MMRINIAFLDFIAANEDSDAVAFSFKPLVDFNKLNLIFRSKKHAELVYNLISSSMASAFSLFVDPFQRDEFTLLEGV